MTTKPELLTSADELNYVRDLLKNTKADVNLDYFNDDSEYNIEIEISWGDWKHDHARVKWIMKEHGYTMVEEEETETDGSDCYSARYWFR